MKTEEHVAELERASELADARLGVAEEFAWPVACLSAALAYVILRHWVWAVIAFGGGFVLSVYSLRKAANKAEDTYFRAARVGRCVQPREESTAE
jgi:hypothetical protein